MREQCAVFDGASDDADRIERLGVMLHARAVDRAEARFVAGDAAVRRRSYRRAAGLRSERKRHHEVRHRCAGPAGRTAGRVPGIVRVASGPRHARGKLGSHGFPEDDAAGAAHQRDARGIGARPKAGVHPRVVLRRHVGGVDDVLHADRNTGEKPACPALVDSACLGKRRVGIEIRPRLHVALALGDALDIGAHDCFGGDLAGADLPDDFGRAEEMKLHARKCI
jgi:hypothetical protein